MNLCLLVLQAKAQILKVKTDPERQNLNWFSQADSEEMDIICKQKI